ncbi:MAG: N-acyl homoserine lactone hydrolase [Bradyrhizobium sp.]|jgi:glyoxylase-like metal-dependent hydrolase (beta-lactamase superfamily II)|nr:N-acyl homoserine lactone hydrolase [Bradyrhizobium sp.]
MFEVHSLKMGELLIPEDGALLFDPVYVWLITDGKTRMLVDGGMPEIAEINRRLKVNGAGGGHAGLREALATAGTTPDQINAVIVTHLHYDHGANLDLFPSATVIIQRDELRHAVDPVPTQRLFYFKEALIGLLGRGRPRHLRVVDGDFELTEGIRILKVPGHTPGMQIPVVTTARGKAAIVSDLGDHYKNWYPADARATRHPQRYLADAFLPGGIRSEDERTYLKSMQRVMDATDIVIPAHDTRIPMHVPQQWFELPPEDQPEPELIPSRTRTS